MMVQMHPLAACLAATKKPLPILSYPGMQLVGCTVTELSNSAELQSRVLCAVAERVDAAAAVSFMDLSIEAEAFGCETRYAKMEIPTVTGVLVEEEDEAEALEIPVLGTGRTGLAVEAIREAKRYITDRPVLAGMIGPFSLAGRLMGVENALINCLEEPDMVHVVLEKTTVFLERYGAALRETGADGVVMAEPLTGLLSPAMAREFSHPYVEQLIKAVQREDFLLVYHNCAAGTVRMAEDIFALGAGAYHFGNAVSMEDILAKAPGNSLVLGNIDPVGTLLSGTPETVYNETRTLLERCGHRADFLPSSGCDIPPKTPWENIEAFFSAARDYYK